MSNKIKSKKYFLQDNELSSVDEDRLNQKHVAKNLNQIIENTKPPYNIALLGKCGTGKSSIVNLLLNNYKENSEEYNIKKINVWKNNKTLKEILDNESSENKNEDVVKSNISELNKNDKGGNSDNNQSIKNTKKFYNVLLAICDFILAFVASLFITSIVFAFSDYLQNISIYNANPYFFIENLLFSYSENLGVLIILALGLAVIWSIIKRLANKVKSPMGNDNINSNNDINQNKIKTEIISNSNEIDGESKLIDYNKKNIIVIEDIDKLTIGKMILTFESLKYCSDFNNCIFIVPFDELILRKAINAKNNSKLDNSKLVKTDSIIDKIFQFRLYVPRMSNLNVKEYSVKLVQENIPSFIAEYCPIVKFEKVIRNVLIYKNVTTPRHVKKIINCFVNNKMLASFRAEDGKFDIEFINSNEFDYQLAKITVLQADFPEFYNILFKDHNYINKLLEITECYSDDNLEIDEELKQFLTPKYKSLRTFLKQTEKYQINDVATLLYLTKQVKEKMFGNKTLSSYINGEESIELLNIEEVLKLINSIDKEEEIKQFTFNNYEKVLEMYINNASDREYFIIVNEIINIMKKYISEEDFMKYLEIVAINYNFYPAEALEIFKTLEIEIPGNIMKILFEKLKDNLTTETYEDSFKILRENSESFYEEDGNVSEYVHFLVNYIAMSSNPDTVITELDENFNRIGRVYELNKNIKGLSNLDYDKAYKFIAKCLDNGDLDRMVFVVNAILSDENSIQDVLNIEEKLENYSLMDVIEYNVDDIIDAEQELDEKEDNCIIYNYDLLRNLLELATIKQSELNATDTLKIFEMCLNNINDSQYVLKIYKLAKNFDRMYFYDIRRDFNEIVYKSFHTAKNNAIKEAALECSRYFKTTRLFKTKLDEKELKFYEEN